MAVNVVHVSLPYRGLVFLVIIAGIAAIATRGTGLLGQALIDGRVTGAGNVGALVLRLRCRLGLLNGTLLRRSRLGLGRAGLLLGLGRALGLGPAWRRACRHGLL